jgi:hypothetical protein
MKKSSETLASVFKMPAASIADILCSEKFSPGGPSAGLRLLTVYMAYAGRGLSPSQKQSLKQARSLLLERAAKVAH